MVKLVMPKRRYNPIHLERRKNLLGMNPGTAFNRLKKTVMFDMARRLDLLTCFRCSQPIVKIDDLSIEHKEAWQRAADPVAAFFSLENIAFSHSLCNILAGIRHRKYPSMEEAKKAKAKCRRFYNKAT